MTADRRARRLPPARRRDQLLFASGEYIAMHGLDFSLDEIARHVGISPPLMRHYFGNRDGLLDALIRQGVEQLLAILSGSQHVDLTSRLSDYAEFVSLRPWAHRLWMAATIRDDTLSPVVATARRRLQELAFGSPWERMDADQRFRSSVWVAAVERSIDEWLFEEASSREDLVHRLHDVAMRLGVPAAVGR